MDIPLDLKLFMNNATQQKVYKCDQCNASYSDKSYFDLHKQTHQKGGNGGGNAGGNGHITIPVTTAEDGSSNGETAGVDELPATVQIVMPAPAHQGDQTALQDQQQQQLSAYKRAYGGEVHQIYEIAPSTRYQVVTSGTPHVLTAVTLASLSGTAGQVTLPSYTTTPTYVLAEQALPQGLAAVTAVTGAGTQNQRPLTVATLAQETHHGQAQETQQVVIQQHQQQQQVTLQQQQQQQSIQHVSIQPQPTQQAQQQQQGTVQQQQQQSQGHGQGQQTQQQGSGQRLIISLEAKERPYKCDQCTASFIDPTELTEHKKKHSGDGPFTCEDCHFTFMYKSHFRSHKTRCLKKRAMMPNPPKPILNPGPIKRQFPTHHTKTQAQNQHVQHQQQQQQQVIATPATAQQQHHHHVTTNNARGGAKHSAKQVSAVASSSAGANANAAAANAATFNPNNPSFKRQRREQRTDRPYECTECDASFQTAQDLQGHKAKHTGEGPFKCEECRFVFLYRKLYEAHRRRCEKKRKDPTQSQTQPQQQQQQQQQQQLVQVQNQALQQQQQVAVSAAGQVVQTAQGQQVQIHGGRATLAGTPTTVQLSGPIQIQTVGGHPQATAVIDMRSLQQAAAGQGGQGGQAGGLQHQILEQVLVAQLPGRQEVKYDLVPATVDVTDVNQIMNLIKVKGHPQ